MVKSLLSSGKENLPNLVSLCLTPRSSAVWFLPPVRLSLRGQSPNPVDSFQPSFHSASFLEPFGTLNQFLLLETSSFHGFQGIPFSRPFPIISS